MKRDLTARVVVAIIAALAVLATLFHVVLYAYVQMRFDTQWALITLMALFVWDAIILIRLLHAIGNIYVGDGGDSDE